MPVRRQYTAPRFRHTKNAEYYTTRATKLAEEAQRIAKDATLSDHGKLVAFTKVAAPVFKELRGAKAANQRRMRAAVERASKAVRDAQGTPDARANELGRDFEAEMKRDPAFRKRAMDRLHDPSDTSEATNRLRRFFLDRDPMLSGISEPALELMRYRLTPTLPAQVFEAEREYADLQEQIADLAAAMEAILLAADRATLEHLGVLGRPMVEWSVEERAAYIEEHGLEAFRQDLDDEIRLLAEPRAPLPESQAPDGHADELEMEVARAEEEFERQQQHAA